MQLRTGVSGLHVCKQITLPPPAPKPFILSFRSILRYLLPPFMPLSLVFIAIYIHCTFCFELHFLIIQTQLLAR